MCPDCERCNALCFGEEGIWFDPVVIADGNGGVWSINMSFYITIVSQGCAGWLQDGLEDFFHGIGITTNEIRYIKDYCKL